MSYQLHSGEATLSDLKDGNLAFGLGVGNVYFVCKSTEAFYEQFCADHAGEYSDGSVKVHTTIQSALDATVACRNDYVIVMPSASDYDITAALTMSKKAVHLLCPAGFGYEIGATNAARIEQTTAATAIIAVTAAAVEIAGFYLKPYIGCQHITLSTDAQAVNIHHNTFPLKWTTSNSPAIEGTVQGGAWGSIEKNWFVSQAGDACTCASVISIAASATGARVSYNEIGIGDGNTATVGIANGAVKGCTNFNILEEFTDAAHSYMSGSGVFGAAVSINVSGSAIGNRIACATGHGLAGGTAEASFSDNRDGASGGATPIQT